MKPETIRAVVLAILAVLIFAAGWLVEGWRKNAEISQLNESVAQADARAAKKNASQLAAATTRADRLQEQLSGTQNTINAFAQEKNSEIRRLSTGRACLDSALVRVLNQPAGIKLGGAVPQAAGSLVQPAAGPAAGADDGAFATDADVSGWINQCRSSYDACRAGRDAIRAFYAGEVNEQ